MTRSIISYGIPLVGGAIVSFAVFACSSDEGGGGGAGAGGSTSTGGGSSAGGSTGAGGGSSAGGSTGTGGSGTGGSADLYTCDDRPPLDPGGTGTEGSACCTVRGSTYGTCTKVADITNADQRENAGYDSCSKAADLRCAPTADALAEAGALGVFDSCTWTVGSQQLEGRCLPLCFIAGNPAASQLQQADCAQDLLCAPCFDPTDGTATGACTFKTGDQPANNTPPTPFAPCGAMDGGPAGGYCVPKALADASGNPAAASLPQLNCATGEVCAPAVKVKDLRGCFEQCESAAGATVGAQYTPGGCVPAYVVEATAGAIALSVLTQVTCEAGELCAPCINPLSMPVDQPTGACD